VIFQQYSTVGLVSIKLLFFVI